MNRIPLSLANRIWIVGSLVAIVAVAGMDGGRATMFGAVPGLMALIVLRWTIGRILAPLDALRERMSAVSAETARQELLIRAQNSLFVNIGLLRDRLYAHGDPKRIGDQLYFGNTLINGNFVEVDEVKAAAGGSATIFLDDIRIATNVQKADGARAVGTKLAPGAAYESVFKDGKTYRGEAEILGVNHLTVYEPIVSAGQVIGILFAGVKKEDCKLVARVSRLDAIADMGDAVSLFEDAAIAKGKAEREAAEQRYAADEIRRGSEVLRKASANAQRQVVDALSVALEHLSAGDLMHRVVIAFPSEYAKLKDDFNAAIGKLSETMVAINGGARTMRQNVSEISQAADDLSRRTEQQATSLQQTSAALNEITVKVRDTAQGAQRARDVVLDTRGKAEHGGDVVRRAVAAMAQIDSSAQQISSIMSVIDEIAFQTNLLALNAGVEAARAGESGKGFAVVASEVRSLAQRSADAAKQVRTLISSSVVQVAAGVALVADTGKELGEIIERVAEIDKVVESIAMSARDQASGLNDVNLAVGRMDKVTQQNATMVEESTAASQLLSSEAETLVKLVDRFHIETAPKPASNRPSAAAAPRRAGGRSAVKRYA